MSVQLNEQIDRMIRDAIARKRLIRFQYGGKERVAEPHDYGVKAGAIRLFCYQVEGVSRDPHTRWRLMDVAKISEMELLDRGFTGSRGDSYKKHLTWDQVFARVEAPARE